MKATSTPPLFNLSIFTSSKSSSTASSSPNNPCTELSFLLPFSDLKLSLHFEELLRWIEVLTRELVERFNSIQSYDTSARLTRFSINHSLYQMYLSAVEPDIDLSDRKCVSEWPRIGTAAPQLEQNFQSNFRLRPQSGVKHFKVILGDLFPLFL